MKKYVLIALAAALVLFAAVRFAGRAPSEERSASAPPLPWEAAGEGELKEFALVAGRARLELRPGLETDAYAYNGSVPGPEIRVRAGDRLRIAFTNALDVPTTVHWHGIRVPAEMDGVPGVSQEPVPPGGSFLYEFVAPDDGTFFYHSHVAVDEQVDMGLYGPLIVEPREGTGLREIVLALDDWLLDARGNRLPTSATEEERPVDNELDTVSAASVRAVSGGHMMGHGGMMMGSMGHGGMMMHDLAPELNGRFGNVLAVNGRAGSGIAPVSLARGERVLLRFINASNAMTHALKTSDGRPLAIIAVDGAPLRDPLVTDRLVLPPAKRFDVVVEAGDAAGAWSLDSAESGRVLRIPFEVSSEIVETAPFPSRPERADAKLSPERTLELAVALDDPMRPARWTVNGRSFDMDRMNEALASYPRGARVRLRFVNASPMAHQMHLHGHSAVVRTRGGQVVSNQRPEDVVVVRAGETVEADVLLDNPGDWVVHCHNLEHEEHGLMAVLRVGR